MKEVKREKVEETMRRLAANFVQEISGANSLITVTGVSLSSNGKNVEIFFTTIPDDQENTVLKFLTRKTPLFKNYLMNKSRMGIIPKIDFRIDYGERSRQRLDELSRKD